MQKLMLCLLVCAGTSFAACGQKTPPEVIISAFKQKFQNVSELKWSKEKNGDWEAEFEQNEMDMSANFSANGTWLETETEIKVSDLPTSVQNALTGKKVKEAAKIERADGSIVYEAEVKHKDLLYDASGKLLTPEKN
ncbi:MAG: PepSY-like domain-containing protein [Saprospiraceae bacterium]